MADVSFRNRPSEDAFWGKGNRGDPAMTNQRAPNDPDLRRRPYSIRDDAGGSLFLPLIVAFALVVFIGYLLLGPAFEPAPNRSVTAPRTELPNPNPAAPPVPTPTPPKQQ